MSAAKLVPGYETIVLAAAHEIDGVPWIVTPTGLVDYENPTAAALNIYHGITKPSQAYAGAGGNISCAVLDDLNLGLTGSDTSSNKTVCSKGNSESLTQYNFDAELNVLRDEDPDADGLYNLVRDLTRDADAPYFIIHRVRGGKDSSEEFAVGDEIDLYYVWTDHPVPAFPDSDDQTLGLNFVPKSIVNIAHVITA
ncbi:hypothetical protein [Agromyces larvae]|uniref:Major tail protein n=1 Tax=Agromyces larvae TaxID=2929802 RepID=A0ABY4C3B4_9MICO|nr:hypothetical protein [Agromyces larvae]UOE45885.1 hypothetical protein MTO99_09140 [Agromyces larvae]